MVHFGAVHIRNQRYALIHFQTAYRRFIQRERVCLFRLRAGGCRHVLVYRDFKHKFPFQHARFGIGPVNFTALSIGRLYILHVLMRIIGIFSAGNIKLFQVKRVLFAQNILIADNIRAAAQRGITAVPSLFYGSLQSVCNYFFYGCSRCADIKKVIISFISRTDARYQ